MPPLIFLHGFLGNPRDWDPVISYLPTSIHCMALPLPGHAGAPFTKHLDIPYGHLIGYSMGGRIALQLPKEKRASLTLLSVHPGLKTAAERRRRFQSDLNWSKLLLHLPIDEFLNQWYDQPIFKPFKPDFRMRREQNKTDLAQALLHFSLAKQPFYELNDVLVGQRDEKFRQLHKHPIVIPNAAHAIHLENPKAVAQIIEERIFP